MLVFSEKNTKLIHEKGQKGLFSKGIMLFFGEKKLMISTFFEKGQI